MCSRPTTGRLTTCGSGVRTGKEGEPGTARTEEETEVEEEEDEEEEEEVEADE